MGKIKAALKLLRTDGPEREVSWHWLLRTGSRLDRSFRSAASYSVSDRGDYLQVNIKDQIFFWPRNSPISGLLQILSEILTPDHPHQYLYGPTQVGSEDIVLDIGACEGSFAALVTSRCKRVIVVEPSRSMCSLMSSLFVVRGQPRPTILNCLVGAQSGKAYFREDVENPGASHISMNPNLGAYELPVMTLDEVVEHLGIRPTFIKCDAEGAELAIFSGGVRFLRESRPRLAITTYHNDGDFAAMYSLLKSLGYSVMGKGFLFSHDVLRVQMIHAW